MKKAKKCIGHFKFLYEGPSWKIYMENLMYISSYLFKDKFWSLKDYRASLTLDFNLNQNMAEAFSNSSLIKAQTLIKGSWKILIKHTHLYKSPLGLKNVQFTHAYSTVLHSTLYRKNRGGKDQTLDCLIIEALISKEKFSLNLKLIGEG